LLSRTGKITNSSRRQTGSSNIRRRCGHVSLVLTIMLRQLHVLAKTIIAKIFVVSTLQLCRLSALVLFHIDLKNKMLLKYFIVIAGV